MSNRAEPRFSASSTLLASTSVSTLRAVCHTARKRVKRTWDITSGTTKISRARFARNAATSTSAWQKCRESWTFAL
eukprot:147436-Pleurochrysis_carterae.AAC.1